MLCWNTCLINKGKDLPAVSAIRPKSMSIEHEPWILPRFLAEFFFPTGFFSGRFFLASVLTVFCVNCRSALFQFFHHMFECNRGCCITYCYICGARPKQAK